MGQVTVRAVEAEPELELVGHAGRGDALGELITELRAQVVVDFTQPTAVYENTRAILDAGARPVIGTTGLTPQQIKKLQEHSKKLKRGGVIAPNFSIGMVLMMKYAAEFAKYFPQVEIIEMHHDRKKDCPSGTALYTAETLAAARGKPVKPPVEMHESVSGSRGANYLGIPVHAIRLPGLVAHEQIIFGDLGETLTLRHDALDRQCFMRGVILACKKVMRLKSLVYGLDSIL
jgi:4-hydroxy-tetrahydrodipicolinate reductase